MKVGVRLSVLAALSRGVELDCTGVEPWSAATQGSGPVEVVHNGSWWHSDTWVQGTDEPGNSSSNWSPWTEKGTCKAGTAADITSGVDCSSLPTWDAATVYDQAGTAVQYSSQKFSNKWWTQGEQPDKAKADGVWSYVANCTGGGPTTPPSSSTSSSATSTTSSSATTTTTPSGTTPSTSSSSTSGGGSGSGTTDNPWTGSMPGAQQCWPQQLYMPVLDTNTGMDPNLTGALAAGVKFVTVGNVIQAAAPFLDAAHSKCLASWAGAAAIEQGPLYYGSGSAPLFVYDSLKDFRTAGGDFMITFGGAAGAELSDAPECTSAADVAQQYQNVMKVANTNRLDFDLTGKGALNAAGKDGSLGWTP